MQVALWVLHCHTLDVFESTPRLALLSPEKGSGKTRTPEVAVDVLAESDRGTLDSISPHPLRLDVSIPGSRRRTR